VRADDRHPGPGPVPEIQLLAQLLSQAEHRVSRELARILEREQATIEEWRALALLSDGDSHTMSEIAAYTMLPPPTLTRLIDRMVADNLAYRSPDPHDRRRVLVRVTARGRSRHRRLVQRLERDGQETLTGAAGDDLHQLAMLLSERLSGG
jgi:DNA-binding MarR family transcriptional regulator